MPTTPKFTKEMLEGLEKQMANAQSDVEARLLVIDIGKNFPAMRDELKRLWEMEEDCCEPDPHPEIPHSVDVNGYCNKGCC